MNANAADGIKHLSQLNPTKRAMADQAIREALLAIVVAQGKPVTIPIVDLNMVSDLYRLVIQIEGGAVVLTAEKADLVLA